MSKESGLLLPDGKLTALATGDILTIRLGDDNAAHTIHVRVERPGFPAHAVSHLRWLKDAAVSDELEIRLPNHRTADHHVPRALLYPLFTELVPFLFAAEIAYVPDTSKSQLDPMQFRVIRGARL